MTTKHLGSRAVDELRPEYDLAALTGRVRGKYHTRATAGTTLVLLDPDVAEAFPNGLEVNKALRIFLRMERGKLPNPRSAASRRSLKKRASRRG
jgi:hypothetical protein